MRKHAVLIGLSLLASLYIYLFYRTERTVVNELAIRLITADNFIALRNGVTQFLPLNKLIIYSLPEGLWIFAITLTSNPFYISFHHRQLPCAMIPPVLALGLEVLQLFHITNGRFDPRDIAVSILFWAAGFCFFNEYSHRQNILKPVGVGSVTCFASYGILYLSHVLQ